MGPDDRLSRRLVEHLASSAVDAVAVDVELWHPRDDVALADRWRGDVERAITEADGLIVDRYVDHARGIVLLRARVRPETIREIAQIDEIATIDVVPQAPPKLASALEATVDEIPEADAPGDDAPLVAVVDSGIRTGRPRPPPGKRGH